MITAESLFFAILGTTRAEITPSVLATEITAELLFDENLGFDDFRITKDVLSHRCQAPAPQLRFGTRSVERMTARLWRCGSPEQLQKITGQERLLPRPARETILYLAYYLRAERPISALRYGTDVPPNRDQRVMIASRSAPTET